MKEASLFAKIAPPKRAPPVQNNLTDVYDEETSTQPRGRDSQQYAYGSGSTNGSQLVQSNFQEAIVATEEKAELEKQDSEEQLNHSDVDPCASPQCQHKNQPHVHALGKCTDHQFCGITGFQDVPATDLSTMLPIPASIKYASSNVRQNLKKFTELLSEKRDSVQLLDMGLKVTVTDKALASWYSQTVKVDQKQGAKPFKEKEEFQKKLNRRAEEVEFLEHIKKSKNKGLFTNNSVVGQNRMGTTEEFHEKSIVLDAATLDEREKVAMKIAQQMKPMVYPWSKNVKRFQELQKDFNSIEKAGSRGQRRKNTIQGVLSVADTESVSSFEGVSTGGDPQARLSLGRQPTSKSSQLVISKRTSVFRPQQIGEIESIVEESRAGGSFMEITSPGLRRLQQSTGHHLKLEPMELQTTAAIVVVKARTPMRMKQTKRRGLHMQHQRQYNPYAADCRDNFDGISRAEIDRIMIKMKRDNELRVKRRLDHQPRPAIAKPQSHSSKVLPQQKARSEMRLRSDVITMRGRREQQFREKVAAGFIQPPDYEDQHQQNMKSMQMDQAQDKELPTARKNNDQCFQFFHSTGQDILGASEKRSKTIGISQSPIRETVTEYDKVPVSNNLVEKLKIKRATSQGIAGSNRSAIKRHARMKQMQDLALQSLVSTKTNKKSSSNDINLQKIVEKRYAAGLQMGNARGSVFDRRSTASITNAGSSIQASPNVRQLNTQQQPQRRAVGNIHAQRIKNLSDGSFMQQDLRQSSRGNQVTTYPFAQTGVPTDVKVVDEKLLDASLMQSRLHQTYAFAEQTPESLQIQSRMAKTVNSVSFVQVQCDSPTLIIDEQDGSTSVPLCREFSAKIAQGQRGSIARTDDAISIATAEERSLQDVAASQQSQSARTRVSTARSYYVTADNYNFEINEPTKYYQKELFLQLPLSQPIDLHSSKKKKQSEEMDIFKSAEFWLSKGYGIQSRAHATGNQKAANEADNVALDYYLSGVKIDPSHYGCVYNAGCCHFFTGKFENARKWFNLTTLVRPLCPDGYYCKALACLRLGMYEEALQSILIIEQKDEVKSGYETQSVQTSQQSTAHQPMESSTKFSQEQITLLHAVCCKILERHEEADLLYQRLAGPIFKRECQNMIKATFAVILVPLQKQRNVTEKNVNWFQRCMQLHDAEFLYDESVAKDLQKIGKPNVDIAEHKRLQFFAKYLNRLPFFRRVGEDKLLSKYKDKIKMVEKKKGQLITIPPNDSVMVVLNGQIILRYHELDQPDSFDIKSISKMGHILFAPELDDNSIKPLVWPCVNSEMAQLALIKRADFAEMWKDSRNRDLEVGLSQLNLNLFFRSVSRQTFQRLICEKAHMRRFRRGQLVLPIHPRSPWNNQLYSKNQSRQQLILESMDEKHHGVLIHIAASNSKALKEQWVEKQRRKTDGPNKMVQAMGIRMLEKVEMMASQQAGDHPIGRNEFSPVFSTGSRGSSMLSTYSRQDENSTYQKLVRNLAQHGPRYTEAVSLRKALKKKKRMAKKEYQDMYPDGIGDQELSEYSATPLGKYGQLNPQEVSFVRPIMLLFKGSARCMNNYFPKISFTAKRLATGCIIGESDVLQRVGIEYLGDIYAEQDGLICLTIERPDLCLDNFEIKILQDVIGKQNQELINMLETRFSELHDNPIKDY